MNFEPFLAAALLTSVFNAALAFAVFRGSRAKQSRIFGFMALAIIIWTIANYLAEVVPVPFFAYVAVSLTYATAILIAAIFLHFAFIVSYPIRHYAVIVTIVYVCCGLLALSSFTSLLVSEVYVTRPINTIVAGPIISTYLGTFLLTVTGGIAALIFKLVKNKAGKRGPLGSILIGLSATIVGASLTNLILPYITDSYGASRFGPYFTVFFLVFTAFAIIKQNLFSIKILATEFLVFFLCALLLARVFFSNSLLEATFSLFVSVIAIALGVLLIRSVRLEVKRRLEIEKLNRQLGDFLRFGTHELRAPLGGIRGYTELILDGSFGKLGDQLRTTVQKVRSEIDHLLLIVETFLDANRAREGNLEVVIEPTDIGEALHKATDTLAATFALKKLQLVTKIDDNLPKIHADPRKIQIVFGNLLSNSLKYTEKGTVEITARQKGSQVEAQIKDTGIGIPPEVLPNLFTQFERGSDRAKKMATGSGIGLYLTKKLVGAMEAEVTVASPGPGKGTTVTLLFKVAAK